MRHFRRLRYCVLDRQTCLEKFVCIAYLRVILLQWYSSSHIIYANGREIWKIACNTELNLFQSQKLVTKCYQIYFIISNFISILSVLRY